MVVIDLNTKEKYEIEITKNGENKMLCPICSHTRKKNTDKCFSFNLQKSAGRCNHCNVVLVEFKEFNIKSQNIHFKRPKSDNIYEYTENCLKFFKTRLINQGTLLKLKVSEGIEWMPKSKAEIPTIKFNYFRNGELINIKYRGKDKDFKLYKDAELIFYNLDSCINNKEIIIVEGEIDCLTLVECGFDNVISVPNGAGLGKLNLDYLDNCIDFFTEDMKFILALDNDKPGLNLQNELARRLGYENCSTVIFKDCKDANECLIKYGKESIIECINDRKEFPIIGVFNAYDIEKNIYDYYFNGLPHGAGIGMSEFDIFLRFQEGYLTTITGIPGHGKSEFLDFILCRLNISHDWKIGLYSPENHPLELHFSKFAEKISGKSFEGNNKINEDELKQMIDYHANNFYFINPESDFKLDNILDSVKQLVRKKGIKVFVIDAWNKLDHQYNNNETQYISQQLDKIVMFCEKNKVHCFLVAHPTKIQKDRNTGLYEIPNLYSISGSANFYNKTANGITVYRNFETGISEIYIQKVKFKHWGQTGCIHLSWDKINGRYYKGNPDYSNWIRMDKKLENNIDFLNTDENYPF